MALLQVLSSCHAVVARSEFVHIDKTAISEFLETRPGLEIPYPPMGGAPYHYYDNTTATAQWLFVLDILNHCFWPEPGTPRWEIDYRNEVLSGYWALAASLKRAMEEGITIHQAGTLATLKRETLAHIFRGRGKIPLFSERLANLRQSGQILIERFQGNFINVLEESEGSAVNLALLVAREFPSFNDTATYKDEVVYFFKRAQLLSYDLWFTFSGTSWGQFSDLHQLTAFADYKLPQVLRHLGIIKYSPDLAERIQSLVPLPVGSPEEVEIRAATIWAVEWLRQRLGQCGQTVSSAQLDNWLWNLGQQDTYRILPYHRTRTVFY